MGLSQRRTTCLIVMVFAAPFLLAGIGCGSAAMPAFQGFESTTDSADTAMVEVAMAAPAQPIPTPVAQASAAVEESPVESAGLSQVQSQAAARERIIIHTATMTLVVDQIQASIDRIAGVAASSGGWVVSSQRDHQHSGSISIRVPSQQLAAVVQQMREAARRVVSEVITSQDVTDEYVDLHSRLVNERRTEMALVGILERADKVEDALRIQQELSAVQENIERLQGRITFLKETSAFSLVTVNLTLAEGMMAVDAGEDQVISAEEPARFRATFRPPEGIDQFRATWDFGDGSETVTVDRTAPGQEPGQRWTATVHHQYPDPKDSPYIVSVDIRGTGETGIAVGEDTLTVTALEVPKVEVFAGDHRTVRQGEAVRFSGSFTRPESLTNVRFEWDPGDGAAPIGGVLDAGTTRATATHAYQDFRRRPYRARLTIIGDSEVGEIRESAEIVVEVLEEPGLIVGGLEVGRAFKNAIRAFSVVVQGLFIGLIWVLIFSPLWIVVAGIWFFLRRRRRQRERGSQTAAGVVESAVADGPTEGTG